MRSVIVLAVLLTGAFAKQICTLTTEDGQFFDFSPLIRRADKGQTDWLATNSKDKDYNFRLNVCHDLIYTGGGDSANPSGYAAHQERKDNPVRQHLLGKTAYYPSYEDGIPFLKYVDGDMCDGTGSGIKQPRTTTINFYCDQAAGLGNPVFMVENTCDYVFEWKTSVACPKETGMNAAAILAIIFFTLLGVYIIGGFLFMRYVRGARGLHQFPNYEMWASIFSVLKCGSRQTPSNYRQVPKEEEGVSHLIDGLDDDFDDDAEEKV